MWSRAVIWIFVCNFCFVLGTQSRVFDVTTVYDIWKVDNNNTTGVTGRVYSRTNALGLPLFSGYDLKERSVKLDITCDSIVNNCSWTLTDWVRFPSDLPGFYVEKESFLSFQKSLKILVKEKYNDKSSVTNLYLSSTNSLDTCSGYHEFKIYQAGNGTNSIEHRFCSCDTSGEHVGYANDGKYGGIRYLYCNYYKKELLTRGEYYLRLESKELSLWDMFSKQKTWSNSISINYLYVKGDYAKSMALFTVTNNTGQAYVGKINGEMVSPVINLEDEKLCLVIVYHAKSYTGEPVLDIFSEDLSSERQLLHTVKSSVNGWNVEHININFPSKKTIPIKLVIKSIKEEVKIARLSSCSPNGNEVEVIPPVKFYNSSASLPAETIYTATAYGIEPAKIKETSVNTPLCMNGGVWTSDGCACPAGFYGSTCQLGCGRNRFGQDCGGLCTLRRSECEGLLMCTYLTGCQCAPGYRGSNCSEKCSEGYYGNNCQQECGHCAGDSACDIYTGECSSCEFGYLPPHCKKESVYYPLPPLLSSPEYGVVEVSFKPLEHKKYLGTPNFFEIQYREKNKAWKTYIIKKYIEPPPGSHLGSMLLPPPSLSERIEGLKDGVLYEVRILFIDDNLNKYDGNLVGIGNIVTKCDIPERYNYSMQHESDYTTLNVSWTYVNTSLHWCPVQQYEVSWKEDWQWFTQNTEEEKFSLVNLLPGSTIQLKVRAITSGGFAPHSDTIMASTRLTGISSVRNLKVYSTKSTSAEVSWEVPRGAEGKELTYTVLYKCVDRPACPSGCLTVSEGQQSVQDTQTTLSSLMPFTQYKVTVTPEDGLPASIYIGTVDVVPTELPSESALKPRRTNTSLTVYWEEVSVCSGFLLGYNYQLTKESDSLKILDSGFTRNISATFHNLTASTQYTVKVFATTTAGWNSKSFLAINVSTSATVPEAVRNLTIYKRGRGMLGLRLAEPQALYGSLKSFTVTHSLGKEVTSHTVEPSHCVVWSDLYCYTIEGLRSNRRYNITVSARNSEVQEDGEVVLISAVTKESLPSEPENLKVANRSSTSIELEWNYPDMANGVIRSFLIGVEETEKYDQDSCCQIYPFVETSVQEEMKTYTVTVSGLHPASTYFVSVSAKTVGLGPSQTLVVSTRPPHLPLNTLPRVQVAEHSWLPQEKLPEVNNYEIYTSLIRAHLLLAVLNETKLVQVAAESGITDPKLDSLLQQKIGKPFYFITDYNQDDVVEVSGSLEDNDSPWGRPLDSLPPDVKYQLVAAQVLEYNGMYNVDLRYSQPFILDS